MLINKINFTYVVSCNMLLSATGLGMLVHVRETSWYIKKTPEGMVRTKGFMPVNPIQPSGRRR
jgi:hypothetical protein